MLSSIFSGDSKQKESGSFDLTSFVGSIAGSTQKKGPSGPKTGVENLLDVSSENFEKKKFVSAKNAAKPSSKPSTSDDKKSKDSKDYGHSSQSHRNGHSGDSRNHKRDDKPKDSSRDHKDADKSKNGRTSRYEDYNPLESKEDSFEVRIKKKLADGQDAKNGEYSPKIKKASQQPSSPKIKKTEPSPSPAKKLDVPSSKPKPAQPQSSRPNGDSKSSSHAKPSPHKPQSDSITKKPSSGSSQPPSRPQSAKPTSSSPAPSKPQSSSKPVLLGSLSGKPISKSTATAGKPSPLSKPSGSKPISNGSMGSKPLSKPGSMGSKPVSSQSGVKKDFTTPLPKPSSARPISSQSPKPPAKPMGGTPTAGSKEALRKQMEERRRKEEALKGKRPMESAKPSAKPGSSNLGKRPLDRPDARHEPGLVKKPMLSMSDKKQALNSIFKGAPKAHKKHYDSEDDDYDENDSFIDDGEYDAEAAQKELGKIFAGYRRKVQISKPYEDDIDNMEVGYDRIVAEEEWTRHVGEIEDKREQALIEQEEEEERKALMKRKRKLKI